MLKLSWMVNYPKKNVEILSGQYGTNVLLVGAALMLAMVQNDHATKEESLLSFLTSLMILQLMWMIWYILIREKQKNLKTERDVHVTTCYIRGGFTVLALLSLVMDGFRIEYFVGYRSCLSVLHVVYPAIHATHTVAQVYFLWFHIKDVVKNFETLERFGVIHAVFTNLLLWLNGVMSEAEEFLNNHLSKITTLTDNSTTVHYEPKCNCTITACSAFAKSLYYLYPFNIEYHIFAAAMMFVMWKNIGRSVDHFANQKKRVTKTYGLFLGPILGLIALVSTIGILVVYNIHMDVGSLMTRDSAISMFYSYGIILLVLMSSAGIAGLLIYRADRMPVDTTKIPMRQLDAELLFGSSVCTWLMYWCSIVAVAGAKRSPPYRWSSLAYALLAILENYIQNIFIIESLYRQQEDDDEMTDPEFPAAPDFFSVMSSLEPPDNGVLNIAGKTSDGVHTGNDPDNGVPAYSFQTLPVPPPETLDTTMNDTDDCLPAYSFQDIPAFKTADRVYATTNYYPEEFGPAYSCQAIPAFEAPDRVYATTENDPDGSGQADTCQTIPAIEAPDRGHDTMENDTGGSGVSYTCQTRPASETADSNERVEGGPGSIRSRRPSQFSNPMGNKVAKHPSIKRQVLKNISIFLIFCNISLWILPAFGCRPQYDNGLEEEKYGLNIWSTVLNFAVPMNLFYHMHSVTSLFEVFRHA